MAKKTKARASRSRPARKPARKHKVEAIPRHYGVIVPSLTVRDAANALDFYVKAFGAKEIKGRMTAPDGKILHAEFKIGDRIVMINDEFPEMGSKSPQTLGGSPASLVLYVKDTDAVFRRAIEAGARSIMEPADQFWGDHYGRLADPFGHEWQIATHIENVSPKQMMERAKKAMAASPLPPSAPQAR